MTLIGAPFFLSSKNEYFTTKVNEAYSGDFFTTIYRNLDIQDSNIKKEFTNFITSTSVSYLNAKKMNSDKIQPYKQKKIFDDYQQALENVQRLFREIQKHNSTTANLHDSIRSIVQKSSDESMKEMFHPYFGDNFASYSTTTFDRYLSILIQSAEESPNYINEHDKANMAKDFIAWWVFRIGDYWSDFTDVPFTLGDWIKEANDSGKPNKKGIYKSRCIDVLYDLLKAIDKKITRADIETAVRKFKKSK